RLAAAAAGLAVRTRRVRAGVEAGQTHARLVANAADQSAAQGRELEHREWAGGQLRLVGDDDQRVAGQIELAQGGEGVARESQAARVGDVGRIDDQRAVFVEEHRLHDGVPGEAVLPKTASGVPSFACASRALAARTSGRESTGDLKKLHAVCA